MIDIIIPIHNLASRGLKRVVWSLYSLRKNSFNVGQVFIVNSSKPREFDTLHKMLIESGLSAIHIKYTAPALNKPRLYNYAISLSKSDFIMCTDADYLFKQDFFFAASKYWNDQTFIMKKVYMLPSSCFPNAELIDSWQWPKTEIFPWGDHACGACQLTTRQWFLDNTYPENMEGLGAMDVYQKLQAKRTGLKLHWLKESQILHQYHNPSKLKRSKQFTKNTLFTDKTFHSPQV